MNDIQKLKKLAGIITEDSEKFVIYVNGNPSMEYTEESIAMADFKHIKDKFPSDLVELKKTQCKDVSVMENVSQHTDEMEEGFKVMPPIDRDRYTDLSAEGLEGPFMLESGKVVYYDPKEGKYYDRDTDMYLSQEEVDQHRYGNNDMNEAYDMNNGYHDRHYAKKDDYFPDGADGPVVDAVGPSGAKQGDNPEQKKMKVDETHKEMVYKYRAFLKENTNLKK